MRDQAATLFRFITAPGCSHRDPTSEKDVMALDPLDAKHALQIQAGIVGRKQGHHFEDTITSRINSFHHPFEVTARTAHVSRGDPAGLLLDRIGCGLSVRRFASVAAISTGALATFEEGRRWLSINGASVSRCKSDLVVTYCLEDGSSKSVGVSIKQCNNATPTNAQLYFTTARGFTTLLRANGIPVTETALRVLRQFCGEVGYRPCDGDDSRRRDIDPRRYFWEELDIDGRAQWEGILSCFQDQITRLLLQKAYIDDPFIPEYLLHKTRADSPPLATEVAIYSIEELVGLSRRYQGFATKQYSIRKGSYKDPVGISHLAPRFGIVQMQRGGQRQHPEQLQFNLEAGYFYRI